MKSYKNYYLPRIMNIIMYSLMKAPDKIYLHGYPDKPFLCQDWDVAPTKRVVRGQQAENIAYIRKDALLEWAKEKNERIDTDEGDYSLGYVSAMIDLIDKIESL